MLIGSHVSFSSTKMLVSSVEEAISYEANTFMIYTGAPQNTRRAKLNAASIAQAHEIMNEHGIQEFVVHAPYIINLANTKKPEMFEFAIGFLKSEIDRTEKLGAHQITLHPGAHVGAGVEAGLKHVIKGLNEVIDPAQDVQIALETMAGKGTEVGTSFEQLAEIISGVVHNEKLSITFDTCHTNDAGYDIKNDFDGVLKHFDQTIGLDRLKIIHLNDSKNPRGAHKDRHANIGMGTIGFDALYHVAHHPLLETVPKILETPYLGEEKKYPPYKAEIEMLRSGKFDPKHLEV
ncbi:deoxyribonuclease IV [Enterococcus hirae]|nr:deoxyribonuclease IV [Enterococcus hirae]